MLEKMTLLVEVPIESPYSDASNSNVNDMEICAFGIANNKYLETRTI